MAETAVASNEAVSTIISLVVMLALCVGIMSIFGAISRKISRGKGYEDGFAWGFFLGVIGIIVVAVRPDRLHVRKDVASVDALSKLSELYEKGILTDVEYAEKKAELLKRI